MYARPLLTEVWPVARVATVTAQQHTQQRQAHLAGDVVPAFRDLGHACMHWVQAVHNLRLAEHAIWAMLAASTAGRWPDHTHMSGPFALQGWANESAGLPNRLQAHVLHLLG